MLVSVALTDTILRLSERGIFLVFWSEDVLREAERALIEIGRPEASARHRFQVMRDAFPEAMVSGYERMIPLMTCDEKDRHVLAAAARARVHQLITFNVSDFPERSTAEFGVEVITPNELLLNVLDLVPKVVTRCLREQAADLRRPPLGVADILRRLGSVVPEFAAQASVIFKDG